MNIPKTCGHIKLDGEACRALALVGRRHCHYHDRYSDRNTVPKNKYTYALMPFEDTRAILFTINQLIYSFLNDLIDESKFTKTIYALQVAAQYVNRTDALSPDAILEQAELQQNEQEQAEAQAAQQQSASKKGSASTGPSDTDKLSQSLIDGLVLLEESGKQQAAEEAARQARMLPMKVSREEGTRRQNHDGPKPCSPSNGTNRQPSS